MESRRVLKRCLLLGVIAAIVGFWVSISFGQTALWRGQAQASGSEALPSAKQVVERYGQALGGRDAILRHTSSTTRGTFEIQRLNLVAEVVTYAKPNKRLEKTTFPGGGVMLAGFDGEVAWENHPMLGPKIIQGDERESVRRDADFYYALNELTWFRSMETVGGEEFEGRQCYHLKGVNNWGKGNEQFYEKATGLLAGYRYDSAWRGGPGATIMVFDDYKNFDGVLVATRITTKSPAGVDVVKISSVTFNDVEDSVFTLPDKVRALAREVGGKKVTQKSS
jgi:hypothetical protein